MSQLWMQICHSVQWKDVWIVLCLTKHHKIPNSNFKSKKYEKTILDCVQSVQSLQKKLCNQKKKKSSNPLLLYISWKVIELILFFNLKWLLLPASVFYSISFNWVLTNNEIEWGEKIVNSLSINTGKAFQIAELQD